MIGLYHPGIDGDVFLLNWYATLVADGDLEKLLGPSVWPMAAFMRHFTDPGARLYYLADDKGWWIVAWSFPFMGGGTWGLWVRKDKRFSGSRDGMDIIMASLAASLKDYPVLVNTTTQEPVVAKTCRLGYTYMGRIPLLFEGKDCHVLYLTREAFEPVWRGYNERRKNKRSS
jgi:hypothetical protein